MLPSSAMAALDCFALLAMTVVLRNGYGAFGGILWTAGLRLGGRSTMLSP